MKKTYKPQRTLVEHTMGYFRGFGSSKNIDYKYATNKDVNSIVSNLLVGSQSSSSNTSSVVNQLRSFYTSKDALINEYDSLDPSDPVISSVLDQYADSCIIMPSTKEEGEPYLITSEDKQSKKEVESWLRSQKIPVLLWQWSRHLCKYGELFIVIKKVRRADEKSCKITVEMEVDPKRYSCIRLNNKTLILDNYKSSFVEEDTDGKVVRDSYATMMDCKDIKVIHVALPSRTESCKSMDLQLLNRKILRVTDKSGSSILDPVLVISRIIKLIEDMLLICRIDKSQMTRIYHIEVGSLDRDKAKALVNNFRSLISSRGALSAVTNNYTAGQSAKILNEIIVPTKDGVGAVTAEDLSSEFKVGDLGDLEYFQNKFYAGVKIPKVYLGYEEDAPSGFGSDPLSKIDARFAKAVRRITASLETGLNDMIKEYLNLSRTVTNRNAMKVSLMMYRDRTQDELDLASSMADISQSVTNIIESVSNDSRVDKNKASELITKELLPNIYRIIYEENKGIVSSKPNPDIEGGGFMR